LASLNQLSNVEVRYFIVPRASLRTQAAVVL
jgi:hypothetical protein